MVKLLQTANPDGGPAVTVVVDIGYGSIDVSEVRLARGYNGRCARALQSVILFDTDSATFPRRVAREFYVEVHVLTERWVATMQDAMTVGSASDIGHSWNLATASSGNGPIQAVLVKTWLE